MDHERKSREKANILRLIGGVVKHKNPSHERTQAVIEACFLYGSLAYCKYHGIPCSMYTIKRMAYSAMAEVKRIHEEWKGRN